VPTQPDDSIQRLIEAFDGEAAFLARNLITGEEIGYREDAVMPTASTIKLFVLAELFRQVEEGWLGLDDHVTMLPDDRRGGSGILKDLSPTLVASVRDHATLMIALSDNTATMVLVRLLGRDRIEESARQWGMPNTFPRFVREPDSSARDYAASTSRDIVTLLTLIAEDRLVSPAACAAMRDILVTQQYHDQIGRYLPYNQYRRDGHTHQGPIIVRSKSGFMADADGGVRVDAGLVEAGDQTRWVLCVMTEKCSERGFVVDHPGAILNGRISRYIYDLWSPSGLET
jgi:beta-lactamase class A